MKLNSKVRNEVIKRDKSLCQLCYEPAQQIHHIMQLSHCGNNKAVNLICLCNYCHLKVHKNEKHYFNVLFEIQKRRYKNLTKEMMKK